MQLRLQRFLTDRTLMLERSATICARLLTRLRLRVETDRVVGEKSKVLADIESMESMLSSALSFLRGVDDSEAPMQSTSRYWSKRFAILSVIWVARWST